MMFHNSFSCVREGCGGEIILRPVIIILSTLLLMGCVAGPEQLGFSKQQWQGMSEKERQQMRIAHQEIQKSLAAQKLIYNGPDIQVTIEGGMAMMPPFLQPYDFRATQFQIQPGRCQRVQLTSWEQIHSVDLSACYDGLTLSLDSSRYDPTKSKGTLLLTYDPLWKRGFTYRGLSSSGYVRLKNTNITVKIIPI